ncbi:multiple sugar transport system permease protein [Caldalkalibacillus uzonensis]|uniref:Multiple sugar transport system permease protein n=1 Tax=Caldalkalibacillus uzonensis TaxID=353224 RepID=A0ABU0CQJ2_9BACI|nr:carbohydrate ABC transporter permease [Caldalkalibacillus uzonensis]MDQ0338676.1 multiple sugar transport system permease protein [Caldalkalibacillus uzonensis]
MSKHHKERWINSGIYLAYVFVLLFFLFPIFWVLSLSLKSVQELFATPLIWFSTDPQFANYLHVFQNTNIVNYLYNSAKIVLLTVLFTLLVAIPAAYAFSRFNFKYKKISLFAVIMFQMISPVVIAIPLYRFFVQVDLINTHASLILVYVAIQLPFSTWFLKGFFDTIPQAIDEAAIVDGCTRLQTLLKVILPVSVPGIVSTSILVGVQSWSQFVIPFILLDNNELYPVSVGLVNLQSTIDAITTHYLAAASMLAILPVMLVFILLQRFIVGALTSGAVKG